MNDKLISTPQQGLRVRPLGFRDLVGYRLVTWREGYAEIELRLGPDHGNRTGRVHGGVYATLIDAAMGYAATWCSVEGNVRRSVTLSLTTHFLESINSGTITAIGQLGHAEDRIATCSARVVSDQGKLVATGQGSFRYFPGSENVTGVPR